MECANYKDRLEAIETEVRKWRRLSICIVAALTLTTLMGLLSAVLLVRLLWSDKGWNLPIGINKDATRGILLISDLDYKRGRIGQYFLFDASALDRTLYGAKWDGKRFLVINHRSAEIARVVLWKEKSNKNSDSGFGRKVFNPDKSDWKRGDQLVIITGPSE